MSPSDDKPDGLVDIQIRTKNGFDELGLINGRFEEVESGLGTLTASVEPGFYKVRQRIGDLEQSQIIEVSSDTTTDFELNTLTFESALPLQGSEASMPEKEALMREPSPYVEGQPPPIQIFLWDPQPESQERTAPLELPGPDILKQFRLRAFKGEVECDFSKVDALPGTTGVFLVNIDVPVGTYLLVQPAERTERCMPLHVLEKWAPQVYFRVIRDSQGVMLPLDFNHSSITYVTHQQALHTKELTLLEVARKALARGRSVKSQTLVDDLVNGDYQDPLLHLIGAHLLLLSAHSESAESIQQLQKVVDGLIVSLGPNFPDVIALQVALAQLRQEPLPTDFALCAPPILQRSWDLLLQAYRNSTIISEVMDFPYIVEPTSTWFVWSGKTLHTPTEAAINSLRQRLLALVNTTFTVNVNKLVRWIDSSDLIPELPAAAADNAAPLIKAMLQDEHLIKWIQRLLDQAEQDPTLQSPLDQALLMKLCSAQTQFFAKRRGNDKVAEDIVRSFEVPAQDVASSAVRILMSLFKQGYKELPKLLEVFEAELTQNG
jgi:hypothetical protein